MQGMQISLREAVDRRVGEDAPLDYLPAWYRE